MGKQWTIGLKLMRYGENFKINMISMILTGCVGLAFEVMQIRFGGHFKMNAFCGDFGGFFLAMSGVFLGQMILSPMRAAMSAASSFYRTIQISTAPFYIFAGIMAGYTISVLTHAVIYVRNPQEGQMISLKLLCLAVWCVFLAVYCAVSFKYFLIGFFFLYAGMIVMLKFDLMARIPKVTLPFGVTVACAYALLFAGWGLCILVSRALYKKELSSFAFTNAWQRGK